MDEQRKRVYGYRQQHPRRRQLQAADPGDDRRADRPLPRRVPRPRTTAPRRSPSGPASSWPSSSTPATSAAWTSPRPSASPRDEAERMAEGQVLDAIEENLPEDDDPREWNWEALAKLANTRWQLSLRDRDLKQARPRPGGRVPDRAGPRGRRRRSTSATARGSCEPDFGVQTACAWVQHKFGIELRPGRGPRAGARRRSSSWCASKAAGGLRREGDRVPGDGRAVPLHHPRRRRPQALRPRGAGRTGPASASTSSLSLDDLQEQAARRDPRAAGRAQPAVRSSGPDAALAEAAAPGRTRCSTPTRRPRRPLRAA